MKVRYLYPARLELFEAAAYYESEATGLGEKCLGEVDRVLELVSSHPELGTPHRNGTRRLLLARFPIDLVYLIEADGIVVVALAHQRREPGYWHDRT